MAASCSIPTLSSAPSVPWLSAKRIICLRVWRCGARWATVATLIGTWKLNGVEPYAYLPYAYLRDVLTYMVEGHPAAKLVEFPWN